MTSATSTCNGNSVSIFTCPALWFDHLLFHTTSTLPAATIAGTLGFNLAAPLQSKRNLWPGRPGLASPDNGALYPATWRDGSQTLFPAALPWGLPRLPHLMLNLLVLLPKHRNVPLAWEPSSVQWGSKQSLISSHHSRLLFLVSTGFQMTC